ncbi:right-handed parallel beta-helix repeat-containing protein [Candidatus Pacearchaeota archaeon]|nr:right-handed parallel beta-helix repeat-containing protein [Candidatus Pacearchaeota archaeon]
MKKELVIAVIFVILFSISVYGEGYFYNEFGNEESEIYLEEEIIPEDSNPGVKAVTECGSVPFNNCTITQNTVFARGNYSLPEGLDIKKSNIILDCNYSVLRGLRRSNFTNYGISSSNYNNITVKNCIVQNYLRGISSGYYTLRRDYYVYNNTLDGNMYGISINDIKNAKVHDNTLFNNSGVGIRIDDVELGEVYNNRLDYIRADECGIHYPFGTFIGVIDSNNTKVYDNYMNDSDCMGIQIYKSVNISIFGNQISKMSYKCVEIMLSNLTEVKENNFQYCALGIRMRSLSYNNKITENNFANGYGISASIKFGSSGIRLGTTAANISVNNNQLCNNSMDIYLFYNNKKYFFGDDNTCDNPGDLIWMWKDASIPGCSYDCNSEGCDRFGRASDYGFNLLNYQEYNSKVNFLDWVRYSNRTKNSGGSSEKNFNYNYSMEYELEVPANRNKLRVSYSYFANNNSRNSIFFSNEVYIYNFYNNSWESVAKNMRYPSWDENHNIIATMDIYLGKEKVSNNKIRLKVIQKNIDTNLQDYSTSEFWRTIWLDQHESSGSVVLSLDRFAHQFCNVETSCSNELMDGRESDIDCGGSCKKCNEGKKCETNIDCENNYCNENKLCLKPSCSDGKMNGYEEGVDCGWVCDNLCDSNCIPVYNNGNSQDKIDVVFVGSGFPNMSIFIRAVNESIDYEGISYGLMSVEPFNVTRERFNFWYVNSLETFKHNPPIYSVDSQAEKKAKKMCAFSDQIILLSISPRFRAFNPGSIEKGSSKNIADITFGCEYLGNCSFPLDVIDDEYTGICDDECGINCGKAVCGYFGNIKSDLIRTVLHEFGHSFGKLFDEYDTHTEGSENPPEIIVNCDNSSCSKFGGLNEGCFEVCGHTNWYRGFNNTIMRHQYKLGGKHDDYKAINEKKLLETINMQSRSRQVYRAYAESKSYVLELKYDSGNVSLVNLSLVSGSPGEDKINSDYNIRMISNNGEMLERINISFSLARAYSPPMDLFNEDGTQIFIPNESLEITNLTENTFVIPYYNSAEKIEIYNNTELLISVDISNYSDLDGDNFVSVLDNCPEIFNDNQSDIDLDFIGDACDLNERCNDRKESNSKCDYDGCEINGTYYSRNLNCKSFGDNSELEGDINDDCKVGIIDLAYIGMCYNSLVQGLCGYSDVNFDSKIDIFDLAIVGISYNKRC